MKNSVNKTTPKAISKPIMTTVTDKSKHWDPRKSLKIVPDSLRFDKRYRRIAMIKTTKPFKEIIPSVRSMIGDFCTELKPAGCSEFIIGNSKGFIGVIPVTDEKTMITFYVINYAMSKPNARLKRAFEQFKKLAGFSALSSKGIEYDVRDPKSGTLYAEETLGFLAPEPDEIPDDDPSDAEIGM